MSRPVRPWHRTQVQWVELYTRQSLLVLLWFCEGSVLLSVAAASDAPVRDVVAVGAVAAVLCLLGTVALRAVMALYPAHGPTPWARVAPVLVASAAALALLPLLDGELRARAPLLVWLPLAWCLSALLSRPWTVAVLVLATVVPAAGGRVSLALVGLGFGAFVMFTMRSSLWLQDVVHQLDRARGTRAALAVAQERLRFSRDVHDVLGRRLGAIAVQAELAAALAARGDQGAAPAMLEVRGVAHEALREARELARGYRSTDLATELDGARSLLRSAGVQLDVDVDGLPAEQQEPAAWVVRETVTNVLRHSRARRVVVGWDGTALRVRNDGVVPGPPVPDDSTGSGLAGLRERLRPLGGDLEVAHLDDEFVVTARLVHP